MLNFNQTESEWLLNCSRVYKAQFEGIYLICNSKNISSLISMKSKTTQKRVKVDRILRYDIEMKDFRFFKDFFETYLTEELIEAEKNDQISNNYFAFRIISNVLRELARRKASLGISKRLGHCFWKRFGL